MRACDHSMLWATIWLTWTCSGPCSPMTLTAHTKVDSLEERVRKLETAAQEADARSQHGKPGP